MVFYLLVARAPPPPSSHGFFSPSPTDGPVVHGENYPLLPLVPLLQYGHLRVKFLIRYCNFYLNQPSEVFILNVGRLDTVDED